MSEKDCCKYCDRPLWGSPVYVGGGRSRHESCAPGSPEWCTWYAVQPAANRTSAADILYQQRTGADVGAVAPVLPELSDEVLELL